MQTTYTAITRQHEPDHTEQSNTSALKDLYHKLGIDDLFEVWKGVHGERRVFGKISTRKLAIAIIFRWMP